MSKEAFVILDPPREGCRTEVIQELAVKAPRVIVYISCDPMTWGRDSQLLLREARMAGHNYRIATIQGLDMFPQTDHIEVFSVFERVD
jgi:tRNA/tmRNA/rRNA uracil-C5-methylase (TrmA/RlmC/RlmD family)